VDVLAEEIHEKIHIKGSINVPYTWLEHDAFKILAPKNLIVTYSIDYEWPVCKMAAIKLREFGFRKAYYYPGGLKEWLEASLPVVRSEVKRHPAPS
jgi:3-mercaptopyruvate sulfurtransferase SseA